MKKLSSSRSIFRKTLKILILTIFFSKMTYSQDHKNTQHYLNDIKKYDITAVEKDNQLEVLLSYSSNDINKLTASYLIDLKELTFKSNAGKKVYILKRDGGTFTFTADKINKFEENPELRKKLESMVTEEVPSGMMLFLTLGNLSFEKLEVFKKENVAITIEGLLMLSSKRMSADVLNERIQLMKDYNVDFTLELLVILTDLNLDRDYINMLTSFGYSDLNASDILVAKSQNIDKEYIMSLRKLGYELDLSSLTVLKSKGITANWIEKENKKRGSKLTFFELIQM